MRWFEIIERPVVTALIMIVVSVVAALILYLIGGGIAQVTGTQSTVLGFTFQAGGALAGFLLVFLFSTRFVEGQRDKVEHRVAENADEQIQQLQAQIADLVSSKLDNFVIPRGYRREVSQEFRFGFCYPTDWTFSRFPKSTQYGFAADPNSRNNFHRNVNVVVDDISQVSTELPVLYQATMENVRAIVANARLLEKEDFLFGGSLPAVRYRINWTPQNSPELSLYQILVADAHARNLYSISFTTTLADWESSRDLFESIANTFRV